MRSRWVLAAAATLAVGVLAGAGGAGAITGSWQTDNEHPFVGLVVLYDTEGEFVWRCSGSLIDPVTFVTAGHCTDEPARSARVYFQQDAGASYDPVTELDPVSGYPEYCAPGTEGVCTTASRIYNYGFDDFAGYPNTRDVGVVVLDQPISLPEYGQLPTAGVLDSLRKARGTMDTTFLASGYGLSYSSPVGAVSYRSRLMAEAKLSNLRSANNDGYNLQTNGNGDARGGTCSGDSGGPIFYPADSNTIVAVTSFGMNEYCRGVDFSYRLDRTEVQDWILSVSSPR